MKTIKVTDEQIDAAQTRLVADAAGSRVTDDRIQAIVAVTAEQGVDFRGARIEHQD